MSPYSSLLVIHACSREKAKDKSLDVMSFFYIIGNIDRGIVFGTGQIYPTHKPTDLCSLTSVRCLSVSQKAIPLTLFLCTGHMQSSGTLWICVTCFNQVCTSVLTSPPSLQYQPNYIGFAMYVLFFVFIYIYIYCDFKVNPVHVAEYLNSLEKC